jgi:STE24 endopeptidase
MIARCLLALCLLFMGLCATAWAQAPALQVPAEAQAVPLDPVAATRAWLDSVPAQRRAQTDAYFEGGYWLQLWGALIGVASAWLLLASGASRRLREWAERMTRRRPLQVALYAVGVISALTLLSLPWAVYTEYFREHQYGLSNQSLPAWAVEALIDYCLSLLFGALVVMAIYGVIRRAPRTWWLWGAGVMVAFSAFGALIYPPLIAPLFNDYQPVSNAAVRDAVLSLARANGVPATEVYEFNASKQHKRISANVAGLGSTMRIALNDNLLQRASMPEIRMVMAHEIGHFALNHMLKSVVFSGLVMVAMFAFARWVFAQVLARWGASWGVRDMADPAGLPILIAAFTVFQLLATPLTNTLTRVQEIEADRYGLNASREPDGFAAAALKLGEYRKMEPSPLEEAVFFSHPSGRARIEMAMRWKAEQQGGAAAPAP